MQIKLVVACTNASGIPELVAVKVAVTKAEYENGVHYEKAEFKLKQKGYEGPFVCLDENDASELVRLIHNRPDTDLHQALVTVLNEFGEWLDAADNQSGREANEAYQTGLKAIQQQEAVIAKTRKETLP